MAINFPVRGGAVTVLLWFFSLFNMKKMRIMIKVHLKKVFEVGQKGSIGGISGVYQGYVRGISGVC